MRRQGCGRAAVDPAASVLAHFRDVRQVEVVRVWLEQQPDARRRELLADIGALDAAARELLFALRVFSAEPLCSVIGERAAGELAALAVHVRLTLGFPGGRVASRASAGGDGEDL